MNKFQKGLARAALVFGFTAMSVGAGVMLKEGFNVVAGLESGQTMSQMQSKALSAPVDNKGGFPMGEGMVSMAGGLFVVIGSRRTLGLDQ